MGKSKLKIILKSLLFALRLYCWYRQKKNRERLIAAFLLIPAVLLLVPSFNFSITLIQSFLFQAMLVYGVLSMYWIFKYHFRLGFVNFSIYLLLLAKVNAPIQMSNTFASNGADLSVLQFNVLTVNDAYRETINKIHEINADILSFQEVSDNWANQLEKELDSHWPYHKVVRNVDEGQGIAIFSKFPLENIEVINWEGTSNITGQIMVENEKIHFLNLHTRSPMTKSRWKNRNDHLALASDYLNKKEGEILVLGDFNTVPWDMALMAMKKSVGLNDSRKKLTPTYPSWNPFIGQIPIDYILHTDGLQCDSLDAVKITSDHKAILGSFLLR